MGGYRFGEFELDLEGFTLRRGGALVPMQPKVFDVLRHLVERRGAIVSKSELLQTLWRDEHVNDTVVAWSISHIRRALGQERGDRLPIETVSGRGYRFTADVREFGASSPPVAPATATATTTAMATAAPAPAGSALVGRAQVMANLAARVRAAVAGHGGLCVITGEAGIGKTRCADELLALAGDLGARALIARCPQEPGAPLMWPIAAALQGLTGGDPELTRRARALLAGTTGDGGSSPVQAAAARFQLIEQVARLLRDMSADRPSLLVVDDLQWADAGTLALLAFIAPELTEMPLCVVVTLRPNERRAEAGDQQPLQQVLRHAQSIALSALDTDQVAELMQQVEAHRPSHALADAVRRAASGVPLFVQQIVRSLVAEHGARALSQLPPEAVRVPNLVRDLLRERLTRLPAATVELLSRAAVIGERFDLSLLLGLVELEPEVLLERLEPAIAEGQLQSESPHTYRFVHALFQSVLYDALPAAERVAVHRRLGLLLLARSEDTRRHADIARHFYLSLPAGDPGAALQHARHAGDRAQREFAHEDAAVYYTWALEAQLFGGAPEPRTRAELLLALATAQRLAGRTQDALQTTTRLLELTQQQRSMDDLVVRATRLRRPTVAMSMLPDALARAALEAVLEHAPEAGSGAHVSALSQLACIPPYSLDLPRSKELSARAVALARELPGSEPTIEALRARLLSLSGPDDIDEVLTVADSMLAAEPAGTPSWHSGDALSARYYAHVLAGRIERADAALADMAASFSHRRWPEAVFFCQRLAAQRCFLDGAFDEAEARWQRLYRDASRAGVAYAGLFYNTHVMNLVLEREGAAAVMTRWLSAAAPTVGLTPANRAGIARIAAEAGDQAAARTQLAVIGDPSGYTRDGHYLNLLANLAIAASRVEDRALCEQLYGLLAPYAELNTPSPMGYYLGCVAHFLGLLAAALGRSAQAARHFEHALTRNRAMKYRPGLVRTLLAHGALAARGGEQARARDLSSRAADEARSLGMRAAADEAQRLLGTA